MTTCATCSVAIKPVPTIPDAWQATDSGIWACLGFIGHSEHGDYAPHHDPSARDPYAHCKRDACAYCDETGLGDTSGPLPPLRPFEYLK
jgi:hypothetical protein